jgi:glutamyl-tRNA reductase
VGAVEGEQIKKPRNIPKEQKKLKGIDVRTIEDIRDQLVRNRETKPRTWEDYRKEAYGLLVYGKKGLISIRNELIKKVKDPLLEKAIEEIKQELNQ